jgi:hypothetical protein
LVTEEEVLHIFSNAEDLLSANQAMLDKFLARKAENVFIEQIGIA